MIRQNLNITKISFCTLLLLLSACNIEQEAKEPRVSQLSLMILEITKQILPCWKIPANQDNADLTVDLDIDIEKDGTMKFIGFHDIKRYKSDKLYQKAADSAQSAILNKKCNPLKITPPEDKFHIWNKITLRFDPAKPI